MSSPKTEAVLSAGAPALIGLFAAFKTNQHWLMFVGIVVISVFSGRRLYANAKFRRDFPNYRDRPRR